LTAQNCPICKSDAINVIYAAAPDYITGEHFQIWKCNHCSVVYTVPRPENLSRFYPDKYRQYNFIIQKILEVLYTIRAKRWSEKETNPGVVFEVGCGNGIMLNTLRKYGWKVFGNERDINAAHFASQKLSIPVFIGDFNALKPTSTIDLIILFQVLEHLSNPVNTLQQLHGLLKPNGSLIIAVPNFGSWQSQFGGEKWFHLDVPRHLFHFSLPALEVCLKKSGFVVSNVKYISFEHDPYGWIQSTLNRLHKKHNLLTCVLMGMEKPSMNFLIHLVLAIVIGILSMPLVIISWLLGRGAIMEVTAKKSL